MPRGVPLKTDAELLASKPPCTSCGRIATTIVKRTTSRGVNLRMPRCADCAKKAGPKMLGKQK
jgi:hypothetical protein